MRPKFEVGEVVLLRSVTYPELNAECTVVDIEDGLFKSNLTGKLSLYNYRLSIDPPGGRGWAESALRKKHQPGEMSFDSLMASLSSPKLLTHQPKGVAPL